MTKNELCFELCKFLLAFPLSYLKKASLSYSVPFFLFELLNGLAFFFTTVLGNWKSGFILECTCVTSTLSMAEDFHQWVQICDLTVSQFI